MSRPFMTPAEMQAVRAYKKWTQADLAEFLHCSVRQVGNYESGFSKISRGDQFLLDPILKAAVAHSEKMANA